MWVDAIPKGTNDHKVVLKFLKELFFSRFGMPRAIISDGEFHFCNQHFENLLKKYGVTDKVSTAYHPQKMVKLNWPIGRSNIFWKRRLPLIARISHFD